MISTQQYRKAAEKEDGYRLWLRYEPIEDTEYRLYCLRLLSGILFTPRDQVAQAAQDELRWALPRMLGAKPRFLEFSGSVPQEALVLVATPESCPPLLKAFTEDELAALGQEGYYLGTRELAGTMRQVIVAQTSAGLLYGVFKFLSLLQQRRSLDAPATPYRPAMDLRILEHWDNLDRTVERGYAGFSLWDWHRLPDILSPRYVDYARANASIGINAAAITNVNADTLVLRDDYLDKATALAELLRPYAIRIFLPARFNAPMELGGLESADPALAETAQWWKGRIERIYEKIPDFGGFVVKANSEGQPGPQDYGRTHAEGANMLAKALAPFGGKVLWRAFVYSEEVPEDRAKQAYDEFLPLDGSFEPNVIVQVKNGPIDFQPREPFHPLFGAMKKTSLALEVQATQEYLGCSTHLVYLGPLFKEVLESDTHQDGPGATVARIIDGSLRPRGAMAAVANIGEDRDWCGHPFAAANWFAFGRLAWNPDAGSEELAREWAALTFGSHKEMVENIASIMTHSREAVVDYMTPLGLLHIMARDHHYGPGPWVDGGRPDWTSVYFHRADGEGIGFDRTGSGSDAVSQYANPIKTIFEDRNACPEEFLLYFHHVSWDSPMKSGRTLWDELCIRYQRGVDSVRKMRESWGKLQNFIDPFRYERVLALLTVQEQEAIWWKDACLSYFQSFSRKAFTPEIEAPRRDLDYYKSIHSPYVPGLGRIL